jgi:hypothetical protein
VTTYVEKLKDPRWQKKRLEVLAAHDWTCSFCSSTVKSLQVHHGCYLPRTDPWDYPENLLHVVCEDCHPVIQAKTNEIFFLIGMLGPCQIDSVLSVVKQWFHPIDNRPEWQIAVEANAESVVYQLIDLQVWGEL